jgi:hypothetical protein
MEKENRRNFVQKLLGLTAVTVIPKSFYEKEPNKFISVDKILQIVLSTKILSHDNFYFGPWNICISENYIDALDLPCYCEYSIPQNSTLRDRLFKIDHIKEIKIINGKSIFHLENINWKNYSNKHFIHPTTSFPNYLISWIKDEN